MRMLSQGLRLRQRSMSALGQKQTFALQDRCPLWANSGHRLVLDFRSVGDAALTTTPVYARDTDWLSRIGLLRRRPMLAFS